MIMLFNALLELLSLKIPFTLTGLISNMEILIERKEAFDILGIISLPI